MKKTVTVLSLSMLSCGVGAQTTLTTFGTLDITAMRLSASSTPTRAGSTLHALASDTSRFGLRGSEDLGDGLRAYFRLEGGFQLDTGAPTIPTAVWGRQAYVALGHANWGSVQVGSQFGPQLFLSLKVDPFQRTGVGGQYTLLQGLRGYQLRFENALQYVSPTVAGVSARLMVAAGEGAAVGEGYAAGIDYAGQALSVGVTYDQVKVPANLIGLTGAPARSETLVAAAAYDLHGVVLSGWAQVNHVGTLASVRGGMLGLQVPWRSGAMRASVARRSTAGASASLWAVGYGYMLSKRTELYGAVGRLANDGSAAFRMGPAVGEQAAAGLPAAGQDTRGAQLGLRHTF